MFLAFSMYFGPSAVAQFFPGRITGAVRDASGAMIADAEVKLSSSEIGLDRSVVTDSNGTFNFPELPLATYRLTVTKAGFTTYTQTGIATITGRVNEVQAVLAVGSISAQVNVSGTAPLLQTQTNTQGGVLTTEEVSELPLSNEDYTRFVYVMPGVTQNTNYTFSQFSINGGRSRSSSFNVDGAANTDPFSQLPSLNQGGNSATAATRLPPDAIEDLQVLSNGTADVGQSSGAVMNVSVKRGTNRMHGSAYIRHRDQNFNAANYFEDLNGLTKAPFHWSDYGGSLGGPIVIPHLYDGKDRTFFFVSYDGSRLSSDTVLSSTAPTQAQIQQAASLLVAAVPGATPNPVGLSILSLYGPLSGPFANTNHGHQSPDNGVVKIDHMISSSDTLSGRYLIGNGDDVFPVGSPSPGGGSQLQSYFVGTPTRVDNVAVSEVHLFSAKVINTGRFGFNKFHQANINDDVNFNPASIGLVTGATVGGLPEIDIGEGAFENLGTSFTSAPVSRDDTTYQAVDDVSAIVGKHSLKFGASYFHNHVGGYNDNNFRGLLTFDGTQLGPVLPAGTSTPIASLVDLLAGLPDPASSNINRGSTVFDVTQNIFSLYATDTYNLTKDFTAIVGLRYELIGVPSDSQFSNFLPDRGLVNVSQLPGGHIYGLSKTNFAPRFAFSYAPSALHGRTVVRGGYGIFYDVSGLDLLVGQILNLANSNPGLATNPIGSTGVVNVSASASPMAPGVSVFPQGTPTPPFNLIAISPNFKPANLQNWNFNIQQEITPGVVFQLGYVGSKGTHLSQELDVNQPTPGPPDTANQRRPFFATYPQFEEISTMSSVGWSSYNSLQTTLKTQDFHHLSTQAAFTWSHNLDTGSETFDTLGTSGFDPQDSTNLRANYSQSNFDQRLAFTISLVYQLPSAFKTGVKSQVLDGWQVSSVTQLRDGFASPVLSYDNSSGINSFHDRPDCVGPITYQLKDFSKSYVVSGIQEVPNPSVTGIYRFGTCPRNPIVGPGLKTADISLGKTFNATERLHLQFRADFFNAFNHPNFGQPSPDLNTVITATSDQGMSDTHFGPGGPRNIQLNLRLSF